VPVHVVAGSLFWRGAYSCGGRQSVLERCLFIWWPAVCSVEVPVHVVAGSLFCRGACSCGGRQSVLERCLFMWWPAVCSFSVAEYSNLIPWMQQNHMDPNFMKLITMSKPLTAVLQFWHRVPHLRNCCRLPPSGVKQGRCRESSSTA
jgi:hypothetical protein